MTIFRNRTLSYSLSGLLFSVFVSMSALAAPVVTVTELQEGLDHPWSLAFLPDNGGILITERSGQLRLWQAGKPLSPPLKGVPAVYAKGQGGLLEVALSPTFSQDRRVYLSFAEAGNEGKAGTAVGYGRLNHQGTTIENFKVFFRQQPKLSTGNHFGGKLAFDKQGHLFITLGENNQRPTAQDLSLHQGKIVRLALDDKVPKDNPFTHKSPAKPEIWSYGHRNPQGLALNPWTEVMWANEHGPKGGDEINIPQAGKNYGWPLATHGVNYSGLAIPEAKGTHVEGTEQPVYYWEKSPGISGMAFYDAARFPTWQHSLFIGALAQKELIRLQLDGDKVIAEERLLGDRGERIRDVRVGPDGYVYLLTDESDGKLLKVGLAAGSSPG
ncbi:soluble aldose sugar dehydrogenase%2C PQQ-dependent [Yersinia intermedia]|jgi:glucose/arabinose dehydrogenase|uniref:PQQ-dependent sugar dehydrogenase n=1 Tax=Yersinia intermedia TaxID=631 RepID=UPI0005DDEC2F|nr:PQQ-dependent sugar dehydrogenase [Yersinia intermedia]WET14602.1 PQQ-dependent sugar dehydrogenase [Yersinia intermedia]CNC24927.1 soluble aldose sugar dehydrogenase%2C PQQ-dependent [Yersinia intermedia]CNG19037.1 soluble aldose sugar dehydrogenase%2C PQQ-dependent [Yersinia intermedia]